MSLAIYEPASGLVLDVILEENAHTQERALLDQVPIEPGQLWIMDRNFCVRTFLFRIARADAFFLVRWHSSTMPFKPIKPLRFVGTLRQLAKSSSNRSGSMTQKSKDVAIACDGSSCGWTNRPATARPRSS